MTDRDRKKLAGVHPMLVAAIDHILQEMESVGHPMMVTDGVRSAVQQMALFQQGRRLVNGHWVRVPGQSVVTNADGIPVEKGGHGVSNHQVKPDGYGHAVDCCFTINSKPSWDARLPWDVYGEKAVAMKLQWGGKWNFRDLPHIELP